LLPQNLTKREQLETVLVIDIQTYNTIRPQLSLQGNIPTETFSEKIITLKNYKTHFERQKALRVTQKQKNSYV
jgi:hypothetical protein